MDRATVQQVNSDSSTLSVVFGDFVRPLFFPNITLPSIGIDPNCNVLILNTEISVRNILYFLKLLSKHSTHFHFNIEGITFFA